MGLGIRERKPATRPERFQHKAIKTWIDHLPKANIGETSRQVYQLLLESNQMLLTANERNTLLSNINEICTFISDSLKKHYVGQSVSLSAKQQKVANFSQALDVEIAIGYKTIIEDLIADENFQSNLLVISINACLFYFYKIQTRCYQLYRDLPRGMWHEIHLLYRLAEQNQFHDKKITMLGQSMSILASYKNILLLSTTNPNQLRQQEISKIASSLSVVGHKVALESAPDGDYDFVLNLNSDAGPFHRSLVSEELTANYRGFSLQNIVTKLEDELQNKPKEQRMLGVAGQTQRHLLNAWGALTTRTFARTAGTGSIKVAVGLAASHYLISQELYGEDHQAEELTGEKLIDSLEGSLKDAVVLGDDDGMVATPAKRQASADWNVKTNAPTLKENAMWDSLYRKKATLDEEDDKKPYQFIEKAKAENTSGYNYKDATIINISPGGFCLMLNSPLPKQTQTGEIIGLMEAAGEGQIHWNIGTIRWLRRKTTGELDIGVQLIAPNGLPVRGQLRTSHSDDNHYQRCLRLPAIDSIGQPETLLTSPLPFRENAKVRLRTLEGDMDVLLKTEIFSGLSFKQFTFDILEQQIDEKQSSDDNFDTVWDLI
jgi:hypothetical protein